MENKIASKETQIVRQSSLKAAESTLCCKLGPNYSINELLKVSELITDYVSLGYDAVKDRAIALDKYLETKSKK